MALSDAAVRALRHADQMIREAERGDVFTVYDACRAAVGALAPVDDFYVALVRERDRRISYPYMFSNGAYEETGTLTYGPGGVVAWVLASQRPYRHRDDGGALLNRGVRFGDDDLSADAVVVPMLGEDGVVGLLGALSDTPDSMGDEVVTALEWLAGLVLDRVLAARPERRLNLPLVYPELEDSGRAGVLMSVNRTATALTEMAAEIEEVRRRLAQDPSDPAVQDRLAALGRRCFEVQASLVTRLGHQAGDDPEAGDRAAAAADPLEVLSPRERAVVEIVTGPDGDPGNAGVARALGIGTATVKTHMASVLSKLGLQHRSELRWLVGRVAPPR
ncbi:LuxR C-terminal-related transcriptional regulator [Intrasporangium sp. YIM S08009]|uniref:LuxR C-terminal-related transcriptional regulator n=1 Tax=Intrasporangium zincisolvens TaxID=3080018 RepID=UPI002B05D14A|nr:LuxR C-terminal-related transcriptional regulator [Intrasporangium sp. YIM S08009]